MPTVIIEYPAPRGSFFTNESYDRLIGQNVSVASKEKMICGTLVAAIVLDGGKMVRLTIRQEDK